MTTEAAPPRPRSTVHIRVNYADVDRMGVLHHSVYLKYLERAREEYLRRREGAYAALEDAGMLIVVVEANLRYRRPARYDDVLAVTLEMGELRAASIRIAYEVRRVGDGELIAEGTTKHALVTRDGRILRITAEVRAMLERDEVVARTGEVA